MHSPDLLLAKRFSGDRPGLELVGIEKAAVPVTVVSADVLAQEIKQLPLLEEFVLRLVKANVRDAGEIADFLGLEKRLVSDVAADHYREGALHLGPQPGLLTLTPRGKHLADDLESIKPIRRTFKVVFDRLTWSVARYDSRELVKKADAEAQGRLLLPARNTTRVRCSDITPAAVNAVLKQPGRAVTIEVLDVIDVTPSTYRYMPVDILVYGDHESGDVETAVVIDGDSSEKHDSVLGTLGGREQLSFQVAAGEPAPRLSSQLEEERVYPAQGTPLDENSPHVRGIDLFDHHLLLSAALHKTQDRLLISTELATASVVDPHFLALLEQRLRNRVQVDLIFTRCNPGVEEALGRLPRRSRNLLTVRKVDEHPPNALVFDGTWVASAFPWLSFRGANRPFRTYEGTVVAAREEVNQQYEAIRSTYSA